MVNKYPPESSTPNWPIKLNPQKLNRYCEPVLDAIREGIEQVINTISKDDPVKILSDDALAILKDKWQSKKNLLNESEVKQLQMAYSLRVDMIHMLSGD